MHDHTAPTVNSEPQALAAMTSIIEEIGKTIFASRALDRNNFAEATLNLVDSEAARIKEEGDAPPWFPPQPMADFVPLEASAFRERCPLGAPRLKEARKLLREQGKLDGLEREFLDAIFRAGFRSAHQSIIAHHQNAGSPELFVDAFRKAIGGTKENHSQEAIRAWRAWNRFVLSQPNHWKGLDLLDALFRPTAEHIGAYLATRAKAGPTAGVGALAGLRKVNRALGLDLPLKSDQVRDYDKVSLSHVPVQEIPVEVAEVAHYSYIAKTSDNPFMLLACATFFFELVGLVRERHIQRSQLVKELDHAYLFWCNEGKDEGRPFYWIWPKIGLAEQDYSTAARLMDSVRKSPSDDHPAPFLALQYGPKTTDPVNGKYWRTTPQSPFQMALNRVKVAQCYPLCMSREAAMNALRIRRGMLGLAAILQPPLTRSERDAIGNWKRISDMLAYYSHSKLKESFAVKYTCVEAMSRTALAVGKLDERGAWDFSWGDVIKYVPDVSQIKAQGFNLASDIPADAPSLNRKESKKVGLTSSMIPPNKSQTRRQSCSPDTGAYDPEAPLADSDESDPSDADTADASSMDSEDEAAEAASREVRWANALQTVLLTGQKDTTQIHTPHPDQHDAPPGKKLGMCRRAVRLDGCIETEAIRFSAWERKVCEKCKGFWPAELVDYYEENFNQNS